mmetsp:Transcript_98210/g.316401  ORF Transcript_98210/g.316401 Transcript_98210/m.316401 type:complete len:114 (-) Transcript_98210:339-680(-)
MGRRTAGARSSYALFAAGYGSGSIDSAALARPPPFQSPPPEQPSASTPHAAGPQHNSSSTSGVLVEQALRCFQWYIPDEERSTGKVFQTWETCLNIVHFESGAPRRPNFGSER